MGICYIFGAAEGLPLIFEKTAEDIVVAADYGFARLKQLGIVPDIAVGDFDSLGFVPECREVLRHPVMKDDTDIMLAVKTGFERGFTEFVIYGGTGGRPDHTFANFQILSYISKHGGRGYLCFDGYTACCITDSALRLNGVKGNTVSVFAVDGVATGVNLKGLLYTLENAVLEPFFPFGVSNEFTGLTAEISVAQGTLLIIRQDERKDV